MLPNSVRELPPLVPAAWAWHPLGLILIVVGIALVGLLPIPIIGVWVWLVILFLLALFALVAGHGITGLWDGLFVGPRNTMSLSRLQLLLWTLVILSGLLAAALRNIKTGQAEPLRIVIPAELWLLLGISTTSVIGAPFLLSRPPLPGNGNGNGTLETGDGKRISQVVVRASPEAAQWADVFRGDRTDTMAQLDLNKLQMFFFTLILVLAYGATLAGMFTSEGGKIEVLPGLDPGMMVLLAISHAGFLANKALPSAGQQGG